MPTLKRSLCVHLFTEKLSLITKVESEESDVTKEAAEEFTRGGATKMEDTPGGADDDDADDLLDQL